MENFPPELWINIIRYLQVHPNSLCHLSLVSRQLRSMAQPALFHKIDAGSQMSKRRKTKICQCVQKEHCHVFIYINDFTVVSHFIDETSPPHKCPRYAAELIPYMINLTHLSISAVYYTVDLWHQFCATPLNLEELFLSYSGTSTEETDLAITKFITSQTRLKRLGICPCGEGDFFLDFPPETLTQLEFLSASLSSRFYKRSSVMGVDINWYWACPPYGDETEEMEQRVAHVRSVCMDLGYLEHWPQLQKSFEHLEFLWMVVPEGKENDYIAQCPRLLPNLNFLILEPTSSGWWTFNDQLESVQNLFMKMPTLERVGFCDLIMKVWARGGVHNGEVWMEGLDDRVDFFSKSRHFTIFHYNYY